MTSPRRVKLVPLAAAVVGALALVGYLSLIRAQDSGGPAAWFVVGVAVASLAAAYAAVPDAPGRGSALVVASALFAVLGLLGILSVGAPLLLAALMTTLAATRPGRPAVEVP